MIKKLSFIRIFSISNILLLFSVLLTFLKVKIIAIILPLDQSDEIFYWTYIFLIAPNIFSLGTSIDVYRLHLEKKNLAFNLLVHRFILLIFSGSILTSILIYYFTEIPLFSNLGILTFFIIIFSIPVGASDTLLGLKKGPRIQQTSNLLRSNLWAVIFVPLLLFLNTDKNNYLLFFYISYLLSLIFIIFIYKKNLGKIGKIKSDLLIDSIIKLKDWKSYKNNFNNIIIQNKDYLIGLSIRTFLLSRVCIPGLIVLFSVFDILITIITSIINNEYLKNYSNYSANLAASKNIHGFKSFISITAILLVFLNIYKRNFIYLLTGDESNTLDGYIFVFSVYTFLRVIFISLNQLILLEGRKMAMWMSAFSFLYFIVLLEFMSIILCAIVISSLLIIDLILVNYTFKKAAHENI